MKSSEKSPLPDLAPSGLKHDPIARAASLTGFRPDVAAEDDEDDEDDDLLPPDDPDEAGLRLTSQPSWDLLLGVQGLRLPPVSAAGLRIIGKPRERRRGSVGGRVSASEDFLGLLNAQKFSKLRSVLTWSGASGRL